MRSEVKFEVKNGAYEPRSIHQAVHTIIREHFFGCETVPPEYIGVASTLRGINDLDLSHYYTEDGKGPKVTKPIKRILIKALGKEKVNLAMSALCKKIAELYAPKMEVRAFWGDKGLLGKGEWERSETCFADGGCNEISRVFLEKFRRAKALVLEHENEIGTSYARCVTFFAGGRRIYLSNFYYKGLPQNNLLFVEALRRLVGLSTVKFTKEKLPLPIYQNQDGLLVYDKPGKFRQILYPCPHCDAKVSKLISYESGNTFYIGCSDKCAGVNKDTEECYSCEEHVDRDDAISGPDNNFRCQSCHDNEVAYCDACNNDVMMDNYLGDGYCNECGFTCHDCRNVYNNNCHHEGPDGRSYCEECYNEKFTTCEDCGGVMRHAAAMQNEDGEDFCSSCYADKYLECEECGEETSRETAKDNLCEDCFEEKEEKRKEAKDENAIVNA